MPKATPRYTPTTSNAKRTTADWKRGTAAPSAETCRSSLLAAGLVNDDGSVGGALDHCDAETYALCAAYEDAMDRFEAVHAAYHAKPVHGRGKPSQAEWAASAKAAGDSRQALRLHRPASLEGALEKLRTAAQDMPDYDGLHSDVFAAVRDLLEMV